MRLAGAAALSLLLIAPALAQTPPKPQPRPNPGTAPKPAPKPAALNPLAASYAAMNEAERIAIQNDLIWTGDYNGLATADFGARAIAAVKAYQKRLNNKETGVFNPKERGQLAAAARAKRDAVGWRMIDDTSTGARFGIPAKLLPQTTVIAGGTRWQAAQGEVVIESFRIAAPDTTLAGVYEAQRKLPDTKLTYNVIRGDSFVVSGLRGLKRFYVRGQIKGGEVRGFSVAYDQALEVTLEPVTIAMASTVQAFPATPIADLPPPRRKVEYGSGVFVSTAGDIVTSRELIDGCQSYTIAGYGPADKVADDKESGLALLRVYGVRDLQPIVIGTGEVLQGDIVGVADPERQAGGGTVSAAPVRLIARPGARSTIEPVPGLGFSGAPIVDAAGRLAGIADINPVLVAGGPGAPLATLISAATVKTFLEQQKVTPARDLQKAQAATVRVICVRK